MILDPGKWDRTLVFSERFQSRQMIQNRGGIIVGSRVGDYQGGSISPTGASSRVTFNGTEATLINASQMTIALRFRTSSIVQPPVKYMLAKAPLALNNNQWFIQHYNGLFVLYICASAGDFANDFYNTNALSVSTDYTMHYVYNGGLAPASRGAIYAQGAPVATTIVGTLPTAMRSAPSPITAFQLNGGNAGAPSSDFVLYSADIYSEAWNAQQVQDDWLHQTMPKIFGGLA